MIKEAFYGHRPVIVERAVIGSKVGGSSAHYLSCKVSHDWSILKLQEIYCIYLTGISLLYFFKQHLIAFVD